MDEELKTYLEAMETRLREHTDAHMDDGFTRFSRHILHEMSVRFGEVDTKLTSIDARLKLQAGLIQSGARAMARFEGFSENSEAR